MGEAKKNGEGVVVGVATAAATAGAGGPVPRPVTDPQVLRAGGDFTEALRQTRPLAPVGSRDAAQAAKALRAGSALPRGLRPETARRLVAGGVRLGSLTSGSNPIGKCAEVVAAADYRALHAGRNPGIVNPPRYVAKNVTDVRLPPDSAAARDLLLKVDAGNGMQLSRPWGQVKVGSPEYVASSLVEMATTPGRGTVGTVDARLVSPDGTPRVAADAFSEGQARRLQDAGVQLRGVPEFEARAKELLPNLRAHERDGLDPAARHQLLQLRDDIARSYRPGRLAGRALGGAALAAASAAVASLIVQLASDGDVDLAAVGDAAGQAAVFGAAGGLADGVVYHAATGLGHAPEVARSAAHQTVAVGFCLVAVGADAVSEFRSWRSGELTGAEAVGETALKSALDLLPLVMAPLGWFGLPILVGAQIGGRWLLARARAAEAQLGLAVREDHAAVESLNDRLDEMERRAADVSRDCDETDAVFAVAMQGRSAPRLKLVEG